MMRRKTKKMAAVEKKFEEPLEVMLPPLVTKWGLSATADKIGVSKATLGYWLLKLGIDVQRVALAPGEYLEIIPAKAGTHPPNSVVRANAGTHPPISVVPAKAGIHPRQGAAK